MRNMGKKKKKERKKKERKREGRRELGKSRRREQKERRKKGTFDVSFVISSSSQIEKPRRSVLSNLLKGNECGSKGTT
jgi:hypothetical protein